MVLIYMETEQRSNAPNIADLKTHDTPGPSDGHFACRDSASSLNRENAVEGRWKARTCEEEAE